LPECRVACHHDRGVRPRSLVIITVLNITRKDGTNVRTHASQLISIHTHKGGKSDGS
jgi:hypothetical protein